MDYLMLGNMLKRILAVEKDDPTAHLGLYANHKEEFLKDWGKQNFCWSNGEFRFWIWVKELKHCLVYVMANPTKGTVYEVKMIGDTEKAEEEVWNFINEINDKYGKIIRDRSSGGRAVV